MKGVTSLLQECNPKACYQEMKLYKKSSNNSTKNTLISFILKGDGLELFEYNLPYPHTYKRENENTYRISFVINGIFSTQNGLKYLNDIIARFTLSFEVLHSHKSYTNDNGIELNKFQGLKSIAKTKNYEKVDNGQDNIFWSIKLYTESLIKEHGEGNLIAYSLLESFALNTFIERAKDKSTLKAKCRSIWNWYYEREWTIPIRKRKFTNEELKVSRAEGARKAHKKLAENTKRKVLNILTSIFQNDYKKKNGNWNISKIAKDSGTSRGTVMKYIKEYENE